MVQFPRNQDSCIPAQHRYSSVALLSSLQGRGRVVALASRQGQRQVAEQSREPGAGGKGGKGGKEFSNNRLSLFGLIAQVCCAATVPSDAAFKGTAPACTALRLVASWVPAVGNTW